MRIKFKYRGFTLLELMVSVAIVSLLASVAIPNFKRFVARAKKVEAKLQLSAFYLAQRGIYLEYETYAGCLDVMGYNPINIEATRYYAIGFPSTVSGNVQTVNSNAVTSYGAPLTCDDATLVCGIIAGQDTSNCYLYAAGKIMQPMGNPVINTNFAGPTFSITANSFLAGAHGVLGNSSTIAEAVARADGWTIDQNKVITNAKVGY